MDRSNEHLPRRRRAPRTRSVVIATGILVLCIAPLGVAATGDALREGKRNGTATKETEIVANVKDVSGPKGGYSTRQSNLSSTGGGAIYGCRATAAAGSKPCIGGRRDREGQRRQDALGPRRARRRDRPADRRLQARQLLPGQRELLHRRR